MANSKQTKSKISQDIRELFAAFDKDKNGTISKGELEKGLRATGYNPTEKEIRELMEHDMGIKTGSADVKITYEVFEECITKYLNKNQNRTKEDEEKELTKAFEVFDRDGNGTIDLKELKTTLKSLGDSKSEKEIREMFKEADMNADGKVTYKEFVSMMTEDIPSQK